MSGVLIISNHFSSTTYAAGLQGYGDVIHETNSLAGASALLQSGLRPGIIIFDLNHADTSIQQFIEEQCHALTAEFVMIGAGSRDSNLAAQAGIQHYFARPVHLATLINTVHRI